MGGAQAFALAHALTGHGGAGKGIVESKRKVTTVLQPVDEALYETGVPDTLAADLRAFVDVLVPLYAAPHASTCSACKESVGAGDAPSLPCRCCASVVHAAKACLGKAAPPLEYLCVACSPRVENARAAAVAAKVTSGALGVPLTGADDGSEDAELDHPIRVLLGSRGSRRLDARLARGSPARARLAQVLQVVESDCLAATFPFSVRALLASASAGGRAILFVGR